MGKFSINKSSKSTSESNENTSKNVSKTDLYKPISEFKWKDASQAEIHQNSIKVYKKYAF
ncbi:MAG: hypothetical protein RLZ33_2617 [Bacteroidota bacterium]|jgi:hypothetical protein